MKKLAIVVGVLAVLIVLAALALPLSNLMAKKELPPEVASTITDEELQQVAQLYRGKCMDCHSDQVVRPVYMTWPLARDLIEHDIHEAQEHFDMDRELLGEPDAISLAAMAKLQQSFDDGTMPPPPYKAMHWDAGLTAEDRLLHDAWLRHARARDHGSLDPDSPMYDLAVYPLVMPAGLDPAKVDLGKRMYHDVRLSGDDSISCASCHDLAKGGTDQAQFSTGVDGQLGGINSPTTFNAVFAVAQFWDGRAADLVEQADGPPNNPVEMASSWDDILPKLEQDEELVAAFDALYGGLTADAVKQSIAEFERSLVTVDSPFDRYLKGEADALTADEKLGWQAFDAHGCDTCHAGPAMGGSSYERLGIEGDYFADRGGELTEGDHGRFNVTGDEEDRHRFKVPTLRNVALTHPYFHDGTVETLDDAVRKMAVYERGEALTDTEVDRIVAFLGSLTGTYNGKPL